MNIHAIKQKHLSLADFEDMLFDRPEDEKWELINGALVKSMVGARIDHHRIISNLDFALRDHLRKKGGPCEVFRETFFLKEEKDDLAALPDIMVHCGERHQDVTSLNDPIVLVEVISPGSERRDRVSKRAAYEKLPSLQHFVLVERDEPLVELFSRRQDGWHGLPRLERFSDVLELPALDFRISLADIYRDVLQQGESA